MNEQITSAAELDALTDLVVRLNRANKGLLSQSRTNITSERTRLEGKAEGVRLALSYVEEAIRARPDQPQRVQPSREDVARALAAANDTLWDFAPNEPDDVYMRDARAALALFAQQPTVAEVKAEALREAAGRASRMYAGTDGTEAERNWISGLSAVVRMLTSEADRIEREARP